MMPLVSVLSLVVGLTTLPHRSIRPAVTPRTVALWLKGGKPVGPEFTRVVSISREKRVIISLRATDEECAALAARFGWESMRRLEANATLTRVDSRDRTRVSGKMTATLERRGIDGTLRTLSVIAEPYTSFYIPADRVVDGPMDLDSEEAYDEAMGEGNTIDLGECVAQELYFHVDNLELDEMGEWMGEGLLADGEVVYDTDPGSD
mmetsp:Transcript_13948/g.45714  ORF Transcript_13948/g.45714 Transcript_13948/m.45714 type:complete len:206 (+) Transcript_13948:2-619(+)